MKNIFEEAIADEEKFERSLMEKYPSLFHEKDGKIVPPECGISCPKGWRDIVEHLCGSIHDGNTNLFRYEVDKNKKCQKKLVDLLRKVKSIYNRFFYPYKGIASARRFSSPNKEEMAIVKKRISYKVNSVIDKQIARLINDLYVKVPAIPSVKIAQVKEKFGTLRFYYDGGNDRVQGMVDFAEYLSSKTCQKTGKAGSLHCRGTGWRWYATLSSKKAKELGYTKVKL